MEENQLICDYCNINIAESEQTYFKSYEEDGTEVLQCFDCYCGEEDSFYAGIDSYADHYCATDCICCNNGDHNQWDEEE